VEFATSVFVVAITLTRVRTPRNRTHTELPTTSPVAPTFPQRGLQNKLPQHAAQVPPSGAQRVAVPINASIATVLTAAQITI
jgi:hypothetical protein